jgi:C4-dicarboxylate-specific signal transduction histidine kinase
VENFEFEAQTRNRRKIWLSVNARVSQRNEDGSFLIEGYTVDISPRKKAEEENLKLEAQLRQAQKMESVGRLAGGVAHDFNNMLGVILGHAEIASGKLKKELPIQSHLEEILKAAMRSAGLTRQLLTFARQQPVTPTVMDLNKTVTGMLKMLQRLMKQTTLILMTPTAVAIRVLWPVNTWPLRSATTVAVWKKRCWPKHLNLFLPQNAWERGPD